MCVPLAQTYGIGNGNAVLFKTEEAFKSKPLLEVSTSKSQIITGLLSHSAVPAYTLQSIQPVFVQKLAEDTLNSVTQAVQPRTTQHACTAS